MEIKIPFIFDQDDCNYKVERDLERMLTNTITFDNLQILTQTYQNLYDKEENQYLEDYNHNISNLEKYLAQLDINKIANLNNNLLSISNKWKATTSEINKYGVKLDILLVVSRNIKAIKENIFTEVQEKINELNLSIENNYESDIVDNYKHVRFLNILKSSMKEYKIDNSLFIQEVDFVSCVFFQKFWKYFDDVLDISKHNSQLLVTLVRIIEEDEEYSQDIRRSFGFKVNLFNIDKWQ
jgi:hypothetical protein